MKRSENDEITNGDDYEYGDVSLNKDIKRRWSIALTNNQIIEIIGGWNSVSDSTYGMGDLLRDYETFLNEHTIPKPPRRYYIKDTNTGKTSGTITLKLEQIISISQIYEE